MPEKRHTFFFFFFWGRGILAFVLVFRVWLVAGGNRKHGCHGDGRRGSKNISCDWSLRCRVTRPSNKCMSCQIEKEESLRARSEWKASAQQSGDLLQCFTPHCSLPHSVSTALIDSVLLWKEHAEVVTLFKVDHLWSAFPFEQKTAVKNGHTCKPERGSLNIWSKSLKVREGMNYFPCAACFLKVLKIWKTFSEIPPPSKL